MLLLLPERTQTKESETLMLKYFLMLIQEAEKLLPGSTEKLLEGMAKRLAQPIVNAGVAEAKIYIKTKQAAVITALQAKYPALPVESLEDILTQLEAPLDAWEITL